MMFGETKELLVSFLVSDRKGKSMKAQKLIGRPWAGAAGALAAGLGGAQSLDAAVLAQTVEAEIPPTYVIDLDGDGAKEFEIADYHEASATNLEDTLKVSAFPEGGDVNLVLDGAGYTANLPAGTIIGPASGLNFGVPPGATDDLAGEKNLEMVGNFQVDDGPGYIGVSFPIAGATHFGYVGFQGVETDETNAGPEGRVFGFGYETEPDTPIAAGAGLMMPLTADTDQDGDVDGNDYLIIQRGMGGVYDADDVAAWKAQFGQGASVSAVPEPTSLTALAAGAAGLAWLRRRRSGESS
jgi:hypothetical protein